MPDHELPETQAYAAHPINHIFAAYRKRPLYLKILIAMVLGVGVGFVVSPVWATRMNQPAAIILRLLGAMLRR